MNTDKSSPTIVIPDDISGSFAASPHLARLNETGKIVIFDDKPADEAELGRRIANADAVISFRPAFTRFPAAILEAAGSLRALSISGTGVGDVDVAAASRLGIAVSNVPGPSNRSVAEHCLGMMLDLAHNITFQDRAIRAGQWQSRQGSELGGRTLGLIGLGGIGSELAWMATALGMEVLSWSRSNDVARAKAAGARAVALDELLSQADFVSLHLPLGPETSGFADRAFFQKIKRGAIFINTARGQLVDTSALVEMLSSGHLCAAGLDVFYTEPLPVDDPLRDLPNVVMTPVSAWNTLEASDRMIGVSIDNVVGFLSGQPRNICNPEHKQQDRQR